MSNPRGKVKPFSLFFFILLLRPLSFFLFLRGLISRMVSQFEGYRSSCCLKHILTAQVQSLFSLSLPLSLCEIDTIYNSCSVTSIEQYTSINTIISPSIYPEPGEVRSISLSRAAVTTSSRSALIARNSLSPSISCATPFMSTTRVSSEAKFSARRRAKE